ncbi:MAG: nitroreductase family protein [Fimbriimonadaceae bacterium]|nr:nitroreductase family protein [Fimbriimonadaceae bacterium]
MNVLNVTEAAEARRAIRKYTNQAITDAELDEILRVAGLAPSPWNVQPWRVVIVREQVDKEKLMEASFGQPQVGAASVDIVLYSDMEDAVKTAQEYIHPNYGDAIEAEAKKQQDTFQSWEPETREQWGHSISYIFLGYLLLALKSHGWDSSPMLGFEPEKVKELLGIPESATIPAIIAVGKGAEEGFPHHRHPVDRIRRYFG